MTNKSPDHLGSLAKGLQVLAAFGADRPKMSIADAAAATGLDRASARRCLLTLHHEGYADYDGKFFTLTHRTLRLGMSAIASLPLPQIVQPWLDQLAEQINQSCSVAVLDEHEIVYIARASHKRVMSIGLMPGSRLPAHCTSMGRVLLAEQPEDVVLELVQSADLTPQTPFSLTEPKTILQRIHEAKEQGFALADQEIEIGLRSIAVPIYNSHGDVVAALNTGMAAVQDSVQSLVPMYLSHLQRVQSGLRRVL